MPILQKTKIRWVIAGPLKHTPSQGVSGRFFSQSTDVQEQLVHFREVQHCPDDRILSEEKACEYNFSSTRCRDSNGRFIVTIPLKEFVEKLNKASKGKLSP